MGQLTEFVNQNKKIPDGDDEAFIVSFERSPPEKEQRYFRYFVSTKRLLRMAAEAKILHADATHKLTSEKLPFIVIGTTDTTKRFHLIGFKVASNETADDYKFSFNAAKLGIQEITGVEIEPSFLVSDADSAIHKGFRGSFPELQAMIVMCFAHVMSNVNNKYKYRSKENKEGIKKDLRTLHNSPDKDSFDAGCALFINKWNEVENDAVKKIQKSFFRKNFNWFIGCCHRVPKTDNALERFNGTVKSFQTLHEKKPLKQFMKILMKIVQQRSKQYRQDKDGFVKELQISPELMKGGFEYKKDFVYIEDKETGEVQFFVFRSGIDKKITLEDVNEFQNAVYENFDDFAAKSFDI